GLGVPRAPLRARTALCQLRCWPANHSGEPLPRGTNGTSRPLRIAHDVDRPGRRALRRLTVIVDHVVDYPDAAEGNCQDVVQFDPGPDGNFERVRRVDGWVVPEEAVATQPPGFELL